MMLRSCSTPVFGSLLCSISESPNNNYNQYEISSRNYPSISFHQNHSRTSHSTAVSCGSSPISTSVLDQLFSEFDDNRKGFIRRAQSEGNLDGRLVHAACEWDHHGRHEEEYFYNQNQLNKKVSTSTRYNNKGGLMMLETIPSFSFSNSNSRAEEGMVGQETFVDRELGGYGGNRGGYSGGNGGGWSGESNHEVEAEEYYKRMVEENPGNPLFLSNYAQFLYESKKDVKGAEEYYHRAILADPKDGETVSQYAKLVWEIYDDEERASCYFERAVEASPHNSHVHAAYASFLWETEEEDADECFHSMSPQVELFSN